MSAVLLLALLAAAPDARTPATLEGIGALRIGLPAAALGRMGARPGETPETPAACHYWGFPGRDGIALMVMDGRLVRIDIHDPAFRTRSGARVGMEEARIRRLYGPAMRVRPHPYTYPDGHYLIYHPRGARFGMIMETSGGRVESLRVGAWTQVQWIEGCQ